MQVELEWAGWVILFLVATLALFRILWLRHNHRRVMEAEKKRQAVRAARAHRREQRKLRAAANLAIFNSPVTGLGRRPVVMVVDDSESIRQSMRKILEDNEYRVVSAENGRKAWSLLQDMCPDLIISDIDMPQMTGIQLVQLVRQDLKLSDIPIMLMTSHLYSDAQVGPQTGVNGFLSKPYQPNEVMEQLRFLLPEG